MLIKETDATYMNGCSGKITTNVNDIITMSENGKLSYVITDTSIDTTTPILKDITAVDENTTVINKNETYTGLLSITDDTNTNDIIAYSNEGNVKTSFNYSDLKVAAALSDISNKKQNIVSMVYSDYDDTMYSFNDNKILQYYVENETEEYWQYMYPTSSDNTNYEDETFKGEYDTNDSNFKLVYNTGFIYIICTNNNQYKIYPVKIDNTDGNGISKTEKKYVLSNPFIIEFESKKDIFNNFCSFKPFSSNISGQAEEYILITFSEGVCITKLNDGYFTDTKIINETYNIGPIQDSVYVKSNFKLFANIATPSDEILHPYGINKSLYSFGDSFGNADSPLLLKYGVTDKRPTTNAKNITDLTVYNSYSSLPSSQVDDYIFINDKNTSTVEISDISYDDNIFLYKFKNDNWKNETENKIAVLENFVFSIDASGTFTINKAVGLYPTIKQFENTFEIDFNNNTVVSTYTEIIDGELSATYTETINIDTYNNSFTETRYNNTFYIRNSSALYLNENINDNSLENNRLYIPKKLVHGNYYKAGSDYYQWRLDNVITTNEIKDTEFPNANAILKSKSDGTGKYIIIPNPVVSDGKYVLEEVDNIIDSEEHAIYYFHNGKYYHKISVTDDAHTFDNDNNISIKLVDNELRIIIPTNYNENFVYKTLKNDGGNISEVKYYCDNSSDTKLFFIYSENKTPLIEFNVDDLALYNRWKPIEETSSIWPEKEIPLSGTYTIKEKYNYGNYSNNIINGNYQLGSIKLTAEINDDADNFFVDLTNSSNKAKYNNIQYNIKNGLLYPETDNDNPISKIGIDYDTQTILHNDELIKIDSGEFSSEGETYYYITQKLENETIKRLFSFKVDKNANGIFEVGNKLYKIITFEDSNIIYEAKEIKNNYFEINGIYYYKQNENIYKNETSINDDNSFSISNIDYKIVTNADETEEIYKKDTEIDIDNENNVFTVGTTIYKITTNALTNKSVIRKVIDEIGDDGSFTLNGDTYIVWKNGDDWIANRQYSILSNNDGSFEINGNYYKLIETTDNKVKVYEKLTYPIENNIFTIDEIDYNFIFNNQDEITVYVKNTIDDFDGINFNLSNELYYKINSNAVYQKIDTIDENSFNIETASYSFKDSSYDIIETNEFVIPSGDNEGKYYLKDININDYNQFNISNVTYTAINETTKIIPTYEVFIDTNSVIDLINNTSYNIIKSFINDDGLEYIITVNDANEPIVKHEDNGYPIDENNQFTIDKTYTIPDELSYQFIVDIDENKITYKIDIDTYAIIPDLLNGEKITNIDEFNGIINSNILENLTDIITYDVIGVTLFEIPSGDINTGIYSIDEKSEIITDTNGDEIQVTYKVVIDENEPDNEYPIDENNNQFWFVEDSIVYTISENTVTSNILINSDIEFVSNVKDNEFSINTDNYKIFEEIQTIDIEGETQEIINSVVYEYITNIENDRFSINGADYIINDEELSSIEYIEVSENVFTAKNGINYLISIVPISENPETETRHLTGFFYIDKDVDVNNEFSIDDSGINYTWVKDNNTITYLGNDNLLDDRDMYRKVGNYILLNKNIISVNADNTFKIPETTISNNVTIDGVQYTVTGPEDETYTLTPSIGEALVTDTSGNITIDGVQYTVTGPEDGTYTLTPNSFYMIVSNEIYYYTYVTSIQSSDNYKNFILGSEKYIIINDSKDIYKYYSNGDVIQIGTITYNIYNDYILYRNLNETPTITNNTVELSNSTYYVHTTESNECDLYNNEITLTNDIFSIGSKEHRIYNDEYVFWDYTTESYEKYIKITKEYSNETNELTKYYNGPLTEYPIIVVQKKYESNFSISNSNDDIDFVLLYDPSEYQYLFNEDYYSLGENYNEDIALVSIPIGNIKYGNIIPYNDSSQSYCCIKTNASILTTDSNNKVIIRRVEYTVTGPDTITGKYTLTPTSGQTLETDSSGNITIGGIQYIVKAKQDIYEFEPVTDYVLSYYKLKYNYEWDEYNLGHSKILEGEISDNDYPIGTVEVGSIIFVDQTHSESTTINYPVGYYMCVSETGMSLKERYIYLWDQNNLNSYFNYPTTNLILVETAGNIFGYQIYYSNNSIIFDNELYVLPDLYMKYNDGTNSNKLLKLSYYGNSLNALQSKTTINDKLYLYYDYNNTRYYTEVSVNSYMFNILTLCKYNANLLKPYETDVNEVIEPFISDNISNIKIYDKYIENPSISINYPIYKVFEDDGKTKLINNFNIKDENNNIITYEFPVLYDGSEYVVEKTGNDTQNKKFSITENSGTNISTFTIGTNNSNPGTYYIHNTENDEILYTTPVINGSWNDESTIYNNLFSKYDTYGVSVLNDTLFIGFNGETVTHNNLKIKADAIEYNYNYTDDGLAISDIQETLVLEDKSKPTSTESQESESNEVNYNTIQAFTYTTTDANNNTSTHYGIALNDGKGNFIVSKSSTRNSNGGTDISSGIDVKTIGQNKKNDNFHETYYIVDMIPFKAYNNTFIIGLFNTDKISLFYGSNVVTNSTQFYAGLTPIEITNYNDFMIPYYSGDADNTKVNCGMYMQNTYTYKSYTSSTSKWVNVDVKIRNKTETGYSALLKQDTYESFVNIFLHAKYNQLYLYITTSNGYAIYRELNPMHTDGYISVIPKQFVNGIDFKNTNNPNYKFFNNDGEYFYYTFTIDNVRYVLEKIGADSQITSNNTIISDGNKKYDLIFEVGEPPKITIDNIKYSIVFSEKTIKKENEESSYTLYKQNKSVIKDIIDSINSKGYCSISISNESSIKVEPLISLLCDTYFYNSDKEKYISIDKESIFVDEHTDTNDEPIFSKNGYWKYITPEELFTIYDDENIYISTIKSNIWDVYEETNDSSKGNIIHRNIVMFTGYSKNEKSQKRSRVSIINCDNTPFAENKNIATSTDSNQKALIQKYVFKNSNTDYSYNDCITHSELVRNETGIVTNIVLLCKSGRIISSKNIVYTDDSKEWIYSISWKEDIENIVIQILNDDELIKTFEWLSVKSTTDGRFYATGKYGISIYSDDCITFTGERVNVSITNMGYNSETDDVEQYATTFEDPDEEEKEYNQYLGGPVSRTGGDSGEGLGIPEEDDEGKSGNSIFDDGEEEIEPDVNPEYDEGDSENTDKIKLGTLYVDDINVFPLFPKNVSNKAYKMLTTEIFNYVSDEIDGDINISDYPVYNKITFVDGKMLGYNYVNGKRNEGSQYDIQNEVGVTNVVKYWMYSDATNKFYEYNFDDGDSPDRYVNIMINKDVTYSFNSFYYEGNDKKKKTYKFKYNYENDYFSQTKDNIIQKKISNKLDNYKEYYNDLVDASNYLYLGDKTKLEEYFGITDLKRFETTFRIDEFNVRKQTYIKIVPVYNYNYKNEIHSINRYSISNDGNETTDSIRFTTAYNEMFGNGGLNYTAVKRVLNIVGNTSLEYEQLDETSNIENDIVYKYIVGKPRLREIKAKYNSGRMTEKQYVSFLNNRYSYVVSAFVNDMFSKNESVYYVNDSNYNVYEVNSDNEYTIDSKEYKVNYIVANNINDDTGIDIDDDNKFIIDSRTYEITNGVVTDITKSCIINLDNSFEITDNNVLHTYIKNGNFISNDETTYDIKNNAVSIGTDKYIIYANDVYEYEESYKIYNEFKFIAGSVTKITEDKNITIEINNGYTVFGPNTNGTYTLTPTTGATLVTNTSGNITIDGVQYAVTGPNTNGTYTLTPSIGEALTTDNAGKIVVTNKVQYTVSKKGNEYELVPATGNSYITENQKIIFGTGSNAVTYTVETINYVNIESNKYLILNDKVSTVNLTENKTYDIDKSRNTFSIVDGNTTKTYMINKPSVYKINDKKYSISNNLVNIKGNTYLKNLNKLSLYNNTYSISSDNQFIIRTSTGSRLYKIVREETNDIVYDITNRYNIFYNNNSFTIGTGNNAVTYFIKKGSLTEIKTEIKSTITSKTVVLDGIEYNVNDNSLSINCINDTVKYYPIIDNKVVIDKTLQIINKKIYYEDSKNNITYPITNNTFKLDDVCYTIHYNEFKPINIKNGKTKFSDVNNGIFNANTVNYAISGENVVKLPLNYGLIVDSGKTSKIEINGKNYTIKYNNGKFSTIVDDNNNYVSKIVNNNSFEITTVNSTNNSYIVSIDKETNDKIFVIGSGDAAATYIINEKGVRISSNGDQTYEYPLEYCTINLNDINENLNEKTYKIEYEIKSDVYGNKVSVPTYVIDSTNLTEKIKVENNKFELSFDNTYLYEFQIKNSSILCLTTKDEYLINGFKIDTTLYNITSKKYIISDVSDIEVVNWADKFYSVNDDKQVDTTTYTTTYTINKTTNASKVLDVVCNYNITNKTNYTLTFISNKTKSLKLPKENGVDIISITNYNNEYKVKIKYASGSESTLVTVNGKLKITETGIEYTIDKTSVDNDDNSKVTYSITYTDSKEEKCINLYKKCYAKCNEIIKNIIDQRSFDVSKTVADYGDTDKNNAVEENFEENTTSQFEESPKKLTLITFSKSKANVAYGFLDLIRFIRTYKKIYDDVTEYIGLVNTIISAKKSTATSDGTSLIEAYDTLGVNGLKLYSKRTALAYRIYKKALKLRDNSKYGGGKDCDNVYLNKIAQSLSLQYINYFNRIRWTLWTIQTFRNHYEKLSKGF